MPGVSAAGFPPDDLRALGRGDGQRAAAARDRQRRRCSSCRACRPTSTATGSRTPGAPTVLVYGHHDVVPPGPAEKWTSPPFLPVEKKGRLYGRGTADDKGGFMAWVAAASAYRSTAGRCPVNLRFLIEGEEETGSPSLPGVPEAAPRPARRRRGGALRHLQLRDRRAGAHLAAARPRAGGRRGDLPRPARPQRRLRRRGARRGADPVPAARRPARAGRRASPCPASTATWSGRAPPCGSASRGCRSPRPPSGAAPACCPARGSSASAARASTSSSGRARRSRVIAIEAHPLHGAANQILDSARARISLRTVPNMDADETGRMLVRTLTTRPPAGARVEARVVRTTPWWTSDPSGPAFEAALAALEKGYGRKPALIGSGASIGFVKPFADAARRALPAHGRRGPRLRGALRGREPAPRRLEEVDALRGPPVRRAGPTRPRRARPSAVGAGPRCWWSRSSASRRRPASPPSSAASRSGRRSRQSARVPAGESAVGTRARGRVAAGLARQRVAGRRRLRRRRELRLPQEAAGTGRAPRARRASSREPAAGDRRDGRRLGAAALVLGARPVDPGRARAPGPRARRRPATGACVDDALAYLRDERDLRGLEPRVGWIHATAHTADLLKFLARDARFAPTDHARLLDAAWSKLTGPGTPVFTHAEDERLAAALVSVVRRDDFDPPSLDPWLARFTALEKQVWETSSAGAGGARRLAERAQPAAELLRAARRCRSPRRPGAGGRARQAARHAPADPALRRAASVEIQLDALHGEPARLEPHVASLVGLVAARASGCSPSARRRSGPPRRSGCPTRLPGAAEANVTVTAVPAMTNSSGAVARTRPSRRRRRRGRGARRDDDAVGQRRRRCLARTWPAGRSRRAAPAGAASARALRQQPGHRSLALELEDQRLELRDEAVARRQVLRRRLGDRLDAERREADGVVRAERVEPVDRGLRAAQRLRDEQRVAGAARSAAPIRRSSGSRCRARGSRCSAPRRARRRSGGAAGRRSGTGRAGGPGG